MEPEFGLGPGLGLGRAPPTTAVAALTVPCFPWEKAFYATVAQAGLV